MCGVSTLKWIRSPLRALFTRGAVEKGCGGGESAASGSHRTATPHPIHPQPPPSFNSLPPSPTSRLLPSIPHETPHPLFFCFLSPPSPLREMRLMHAQRQLGVPEQTGGPLDIFPQSVLHHQRQHLFTQATRRDSPPHALLKT